MEIHSLILPRRETGPAPEDSTARGNLPDTIPANAQAALAPGILLTATLRWPVAARLAMVFAKMGCRVDALCPRQHPVAKTHAVRKIYQYSALQPLVSLHAAIQSAAPDLIIPCDDDAALHLYHLYLRAGAVHHKTHALRTLITRSLGSPEACAFATSRGQVIALAEDAGVRVPDTDVVTEVGEMRAWFTQHGFPAVIKIDCTWGGQGVAIVHSYAEAQRAFVHMAARPAMVSSMARAFLDRDPLLFLNALKKTRRVVTLQSFIAGRPANRAVACWQGRVLAGISVEAIHTQHPTGPATVVQVIENAEMSEAVNRLVHRLGISGLWGFDFILEAPTRAAYLIEVNPRATPICHLELGADQNLPVALYAQLMGSLPGVAPARIDHDVIAMFPGEWHRDPASPYLRRDYHDIPTDEPALIRECIDRPWSERGLVARAWARIRSRPSLSSTRRKGQADAHQISLDAASNRLIQGKHKFLASTVRIEKKSTHSR